MHSFWSRSNSVLTTASTALFVICAFTTITDVFHKSEPELHLELTKVEQLSRNRKDSDQTKLSMLLDMDLTSVFSWNTKQLFVFVQAEYETKPNQLNQVVLWDKIIVDKRKAKIKSKLRQKYQFDDDGNHLRDLNFNLTVAWNVMPKVGGLYTNSKTFSNFLMPSDYS
eukprot:g8828.t1